MTLKMVSKLQMAEEIDRQYHETLEEERLTCREVKKSYEKLNNDLRAKTAEYIFNHSLLYQSQAVIC